MDGYIDNRGRNLALVAIVAASFSLRIGLVAVGPVLNQIRAATGMGAALAGALGAIPFLCMAVFAHVGVPLIRRLGERRLIFNSLVLIVAGTLARAVMPTAALVVVMTIPLGTGIALIGLSLPTVIKRSFSVRMGASTGAYVASQALGATIVALSVVPISRALGGWRAAFALTVLPTLIALPLWLLLPKERVASGGEPRGSTTRQLRRPSVRGLLLAAVFGLQSMCYAGMITWVPTVCVHAGWSAGEAGLASAMISLLGIPVALIVPALSDRGDRSRWLLVAALVMGVGIAGVALAATHLLWLWIISFSLGAGAVFPLALTLPLDLAQTSDDVTELTSWMLGYGYLLSATGPLMVGGLYGLTGGFTLPLVVLAMLGTSAGVIAMIPAIRTRRKRLTQVFV